MNGDEIRSIFRDACADTMVGRPPCPADARHLGELVGQLRRTIQERDAGRGRGSGIGHLVHSPNRPAGQPAMVTLVTRVPPGEDQGEEPTPP
jgi:transitional endoplasmic reticulum ATPase